MLQPSDAGACAFVLPPPPPGETFDPARVNVFVFDGDSSRLWHVAGDDPAGCGAYPSAGWYYDDPLNPTQVIICSGNCVPGEVSIEFGCATFTPG